MIRKFSTRGHGPRGKVVPAKAGCTGTHAASCLIVTLTDRRWGRVGAAVAVSILLAETPGAQPVSWPPPDGVAASAAVLGATAAEQREVSRFYATAGGPAWTVESGALGQDGRRVLEVLRAASRHGLDPSACLTPGVAAAIEGADGAGRRVAREAAVTLATLRYARHLHLGRVDPRQLGARFPTWDEPHDFASLIARARARGRVVEDLEALAPPWPVYRALVEALGRYRGLATQPLPAMPLPEVSVKAGATWAGLDAVRARLRAFGDLAPADGGSGPAYDAATAAAVSRFQARHGLEPDGVLGRRTAAALQVSPGQRAAQIELALERLRWVPDLGTRRVIAVNIPMFQLAMWEAGRLREPPARVMKVIVGEAVRTETPVFLETLSHVIFRPYWNVPVSIVQNEVLPALRRDARYLERQRMELLRGPGDDAPVVPADAAGVAALAEGAVRLRQRPGPANALGLVKFVFPNRESVYMHGTPTPALFARDRRDFSHGCIRVEDPAGLAAWVLGGVSGWSPDRIADAMQGADNTRVDVAAPIDVVLFYLTAAADPAGAVHFADDIYGHDRALAAALSALRRR